MKNTIFLFLVLVYTTHLHAQITNPEKDKIVGKVYKKIDEFNNLKNFKEEEGILIGPIANKIGFRKYTKDNYTIVVCTKHLENNKNKVLAILDIGKISNNMKVLMGTCRSNKIIDEYIVCLVKTTNTPTFKMILRSWRVDISNGIFIPISKENIDCINEEYDNVL